MPNQNDIVIPESSSDFPNTLSLSHTQVCHTLSLLSTHTHTHTPQAPAVGRAVSELIIDGTFQTIDLTRFGPERLARGEKVLERNIV